MSLNHTEAPDAHSGSKATKPGADGVTRAAARREVPAVRRACGALWLLARHPQGLTLSRVARELEIIPSSCLHILRELGVGRLVTYDANTKLYRLGSGILSLGLVGLFIGPVILGVTYTLLRAWLEETDQTMS